MLPLLSTRYKVDSRMCHKFDASGYIRFILHAITQHMCVYFCPEYPRQKYSSPRLALQSQGRTEWIRDLLSVRNILTQLWRQQLCKILRENMGNFHLGNLNKSASFPLIHCCEFRIEFIQTTFQPAMLFKSHAGSV